jgi:hypothetical protein
MSSLDTYRIRFRFRLRKRLNVDAHEHRFTVSGREVVLFAPLPETAIADSDWLVMNVRGFRSEADAKLFGTKLKAACEVSSVGARLGIDAGVDLPTGGFGKIVKDHAREQLGVLRFSFLRLAPAASCRVVDNNRPTTGRLQETVRADPIRET